MDKKMEVLKLLQQDARFTAAQIAKMLGLSVEETSDIINALEKEKYIVKYTALVNKEKMNDGHVQALIEVKVSPQKNMGFDAIAEKLYRIPQVKSVYLMSGAYDLMVIIEGSSLKDVAMFVSERLSSIDNVISTATHFILKQYKTEGVIMPTESNDDRLVVSP